MLMIKARISISRDWFRKSEKHDTGAIGIPRWINPMKHQSRFTLIEALLALVLVSIVAVVFLMALATATKATAPANIRTMAESPQACCFMVSIMRFIPAREVTVVKG